MRYKKDEHNTTGFLLIFLFLFHPRKKGLEKQMLNLKRDA